MGLSNLPPGVTQAMIDRHFGWYCSKCDASVEEAMFEDESGEYYLCPRCGHKEYI